ncbi:MAG: glycosyltransferase family 4 protein [Phycisphaerae bacterium]|nr:glycosyltransferase family 4 protein [Phycisphaerae bacterium]
MGRFAFVQMGTLSHVNTILVEAMRDAFPEHQLDVIDLLEILSFRRTTLALVPWTLAEYGPTIFRSKKELAGRSLASTKMYQEFSRTAADALRQYPYDGVFQTQTLFDASLPGKPFFIFTDNTALANTYYAHFDKRRLPSGRWLELEAQTYERADRVFVCSKHVERSLIELYGFQPSKAEHVGAGANVTGNSPPRRVEDYASREILFVARHLWEGKGGPELERAFEVVLRQMPDAKLTIVGVRPRIRVPNCTTMGPVPLAELDHYYRRASVFCMPSRVDCAGNVYLEALHYRLPIVGAPVGHVPELVSQDVGFSVDPGDVEGLAAALLSLLSDPARCKDFGDRGHEIVAGFYTWPRVAGRIRRCFDEVMANRPATSS